MIKNMSKETSSGDDKTKLIIIALIAVAVVLAGVFAFVGFGNHSQDSQSVEQQAVDTASQQVSNDNQQSQPVQANQNTQPKATTAMEILGGSFSTGSGLSDKTYASIYVGPEHAGENVKIQIYYSRDGSDLNNGNMVPKTVDSSGYINVASADSYKYYPDFAEINLYDASGNLLDTQSVSLNPDSGTQSF